METHNSVHPSGENCLTEEERHDGESAVVNDNGCMGKLIDSPNYSLSKRALLSSACSDTNDHKSARLEEVIESESSQTANSNDCQAVEHSLTHRGKKWWLHKHETETPASGSSVAAYPVNQRVTDGTAQCVDNVSDGDGNQLSGVVLPLSTVDVKVDCADVPYDSVENSSVGNVPQMAPDSSHADTAKEVSDIKADECLSRTTSCSLKQQFPAAGYPEQSEKQKCLPAAFASNDCGPTSSALSTDGAQRNDASPEHWPSGSTSASVKRQSAGGKSKADLARKRLASKRPSLSVLKRTGQRFVQDMFCNEYSRINRLPKCRECRMKPYPSQPPTTHQQQQPSASSGDADTDEYCRFTSFRQLRYSRAGLLLVAGFCDPHRDADAEDMAVWLPDDPPDDSGTDAAANASTDDALKGRRCLMDAGVARLLVTHVGAQFCRLVEQEEGAWRVCSAAEHTTDDSKPIVVWKRMVDGCREMCDVCNTTLFNTHWVCGKCGYAVCIDCRAACVNDAGGSGDSRWMPCNGRQSHEPARLMLTQIIAGDALATLNRRLHAARRAAGLASCQCPEAVRQDAAATSECGPLSASDGRSVTSSCTDYTNRIGATNSDGSSGCSSSDDSDTDEAGASLRQMLGVDATVRTAPPPVLDAAGTVPPLDGVVTDAADAEAAVSADRRTGGAGGRLMTLAESRLLYPHVRHAWLCDGRLLWLMACDSGGSVELFRDQWRHGQPVLCSGVGQRLRADLWTVQSFVRDFGHVRHSLINCSSGRVVPNQPMLRFWQGFELVSQRLLDDAGLPMILKLKDWPPGEDFADMMPRRFDDLMSVLPMPEYTRRDGRLNLASCLPDTFVRPDLGPKMYIAYGCARHADRASTNLHLDVSDAVNIMVHVTVPADDTGDDDGDEPAAASAMRAIAEAGCDAPSKQRARHELPGALWHIYRAADADKIRDLLNRVALERGHRLDRRHDPIHDQSWYLDGELRRRLYVEYGVEGLPIVQCSGDAVFIPAGAPHQVRNLHSCIKVAEDFVSPENVGHCFDLTHEFRSLSDTHTNHEDKLQIKNIVYHAMKEAVSCLPCPRDY